MTFPAIKSFHASHRAKRHLFLTLAEKATAALTALLGTTLEKEGSERETSYSLNPVSGGLCSKTASAVRALVKEMGSRSKRVEEGADTALPRAGLSIRSGSSARSILLHHVSRNPEAAGAAPSPRARCPPSPAPRPVPVSPLAPPLLARRP